MFPSGGHPHTGWSTTADHHLGELNGSAQARWQKTVEVFNEHGEGSQLKLFSSEAEAPDDPNVARVLQASHPQVEDLYEMAVKDSQEGPHLILRQITFCICSQVETFS